MGVIDTDVLALHDLFRHVYPDFTLNHVLVYRYIFDNLFINKHQFQ